jgi:putative SOS response-associated peptidase YedK
MCGRYVSPDTAAIEHQWQIGRRFSHNARIVHPRMPLALSPGAESAWLKSGAVAADTDTIEHYAVRRLVNSAAAEGPELIEPMAA